MDILTPLGQQTVEDEKAAQALWQQYHPQFKYIPTPKNSPAYVDAVIVDGHKILAAVETKCRYDMDLDKFDRERSGEWLITYDKLINATRVASGLGVPLVGFLYLVSEQMLLTIKIANSNGEIVCEHRIADTTTQETVNGGVIKRKNAFIKMSNARLYK